MTVLSIIRKQAVIFDNLEDLISTLIFIDFF